jgi:hypothetical protein
MLIDFADPGSFPISSPVVGAPTDRRPFSADIHLYVDPLTRRGRRITLYADSQGIRDEMDPLSAEFTHKTKLQKKVRNMRWGDSTEECKSEFAVNQLYPRLLYTLSDVVVFVLQNTDSK